MNNRQPATKQAPQWAHVTISRSSATLDKRLTCDFCSYLATYDIVTYTSTGEATPCNVCGQCASMFLAGADNGSGGFAPFLTYDVLMFALMGLPVYRMLKIRHFEIAHALRTSYIVRDDNGTIVMEGATYHDVLEFLADTFNITAP